MKILHGGRWSWMAAGFLGLLCVAGPALAQDTSTSAPSTASSTPAPSTPVLSYGVSDIIQLSQAQVSEATILAYIKNSGNSYGLDASQIVYLQQQGVSSTVVNAMLSQPKAGTVAGTQGTIVADPAQLGVPPPQPVLADAPAPDCAPPASTVSVYVIPDTATQNYYNVAYANEGSCWSFYPTVTYIGGGGWVGSRGGWHGGGGWHGSGGWHGTGGWHNTGGWHH